jgi:hypothetical protein
LGINSLRLDRIIHGQRALSLLLERLQAGAPSPTRQTDIRFPPLSNIYQPASQHGHEKEGVGATQPASLAVEHRHLEAIDSLLHEWSVSLLQQNLQQTDASRRSLTNCMSIAQNPRVVVPLLGRSTPCQ